MTRNECNFFLEKVFKPSCACPPAHPHPRPPVKFRRICRPFMFSCLFGVLGSRCLTGSALLDCHVLLIEGFGIYMIRILDSLSDAVEALYGHSPCNLDM